MERLLRATVNTWKGLIAATRSEEAFRQELVALAFAVPLGRPPRYGWLPRRGASALLRLSRGR